MKKNVRNEVLKFKIGSENEKECLKMFEEWQKNVRNKVLN